jgi:uncharacterized protein YkwD
LSLTHDVPSHSRAATAAALHPGWRRRSVVWALVAVLVTAVLWVALPQRAGAQTTGSAVSIAATPSGQGAWVVDANGRVSALGDAAALGSASGAPAVGLTPTPSGAGYWITASNGTVYPFGDAAYHGSVAGMALKSPIIGMASSPGGHGYWLLAGDGGIFSFGDTVFHGSTGALVLAAPIVGMATTPTGRGYWLVASDGGIFAFGDAGFYGSTGSMTLAAPIVGMAATPTGRGYWLVASDGGVFAFGDAAFAGSAAQANAGRVVALTRTALGGGYEVATADGRVLAFSPSAVACPAWVFACLSAGSGPAAKGEAPIAGDILARHNEERAARGLGPLAWDPALANLANDWSRQMAVNGFTHRSLRPVITSPYFSGYAAMAENIFWGSGNLASSGAAHLAWMTNDGHRTNLLNPGYETVGIGAYCAPDGKLWMTVYFGRLRGSSAAALAPAAHVPPRDPIVRADGGGIGC